jgi:cytidylate kinase
MAALYAKAWEKRLLEEKTQKGKPTRIAPTICFSRKIGVGALEIADQVAEQMSYRVADRLIIERIAENRDLRNKTVAFFDERYPGKLTELSTLLFGEKSFIMSDYMRGLCSAVFALAENEPTIFVGRGAHLLLPRDRVLAVRCIASREYRTRRLANILGVSAEEAGKKLDVADSEQRIYFRRAFGKKDALPDEFDLVINCDYIGGSQNAAAVVVAACQAKFKGELA